jgi:hypothetical protein
MSSLVDTLYEPHVAAARNAAAHHPSVAALLDPALKPEALERFLLEYCAHGVHVTEPVEGWIRRAGERCKELGLRSVGDALIKHAAHEANHHELFIADARHLAARWNRRGHTQLDADALIERPLTEGMRKYIDLHEAVIASEHPYAQVAIELEVERLSTTVLPGLLEQFQRVLGRDVLSQLSFLTEHAALDVGHTHLNGRLLEQLLALRPEVAEQVANVGAAALDAYMQFFGECLSAVRAELGQQPA